MKSFTYLSALVCLMLSGLMVGCGKDAGQNGENAPTAQEQIQQINNNPNMPPQAKAMAIRQIQARQGGGAAPGSP